MDELELANRFDRRRPQLRAVAYRILGSLNDADDAVQEAWLRLQRTDPAQIENLERWLTTVVARICLNMLRLRRTRGEQPLGGFLPEPIIDNPAVGTGRAQPAGRLGRDRAAGRAGHSAGRAAGVRAARHVRGAVRRNRRWSTAHRRRPPSRRPPSRAQAAPPDRTWPPADGRQCLLRRLPRGWPGGAGGGFDPVVPMPTATAPDRAARRREVRRRRWPGGSRRSFVRRWSTAPSRSRSTASAR